MVALILRELESNGGDEAAAIEYVINICKTKYGNSLNQMYKNALDAKLVHSFFQ